MPVGTGSFQCYDCHPETDDLTLISDDASLTAGFDDKRVPSTSVFIVAQVDVLFHVPERMVFGVSSDLVCQLITRNLDGLMMNIKPAKPVLENVSVPCYDQEPSGALLSSHLDSSVDTPS